MLSRGFGIENLLFWAVGTLLSDPSIVLQVRVYMPAVGDDNGAYG